MPRVLRLNPIFTISRERLVMATQLASPIQARRLGNRVASLADEHETIMNAFDMLLTGY